MVVRKKLLLIAGMFAIAGIIIGLGISTSLNLSSMATSEQPTISKESIDVLSKVNQAMAEVVAVVKPAVVNISFTYTIQS